MEGTASEEQLVEADTGVDILRNLSVPSFSTIATKEVNENFLSSLVVNILGAVCYLSLSICMAGLKLSVQSMTTGEQS